MSDAGRSIVRFTVLLNVAIAGLFCWSAVATADPATRIATLSPGHAEILLALGAGQTLVLVPEDPALVGHLPAAVRYRRMPSAESLMAQRPDWLIAGNPGRDRPLMTQAERLGLDVTMIERTRPAIERIRALGALAGQNAQAERLVAETQRDYAVARRTIGNAAPVAVLHVSSQGAGPTGAVTGAGASTAVDGLIRRAGGRNVGAEAGLTRYQTLSAEGVMAMAPSAVLVSRAELAALGGREGIWQQVPGLALTPAGRARRLIVLDHAAVKFDGARSGPATRALARALHDS